MSSETPADRPGAGSESGAARPRRALLSDDPASPADPAAAGSPSTPVRFPARTAGTTEPDLDETREFRLPTGDEDPAAGESAAARRSAGSARETTAAQPDADARRRTGNGGQRPQPAKKAAARPGNKQAGNKQGGNKQRPGGRAPGKQGGKPGAKKAGNKQGAKKAATKNAGAKNAGAKKAAATKPGNGQQFRVLQGMGRMDAEQQPDQSHLPAEQRTDLAVRVNNLYVTYRTSFEKKPTLRQALMRFGRGERAVREVAALKDLSFEVRTGTSLGIIGANGAGKSTLMRTVSGILPPSKGSVEVWGQASSLLALGVGFNNSLSGRENIILGGLATGLSRDEVEDRANEIADWTELGDFIDMPMRTYSSGMAARVAFSVGVHMEPDILMIDEALSTGDAHFKEKASEKMAELRSKARAMFLVSHGLGTIKELCDKAIWIDKGVMQREGDPEEVVDEYLDFMKARKSAATMDDF